MASFVPPPMPTMDHMHYTDFDRVYEPAEDSFLFMDALSDVSIVHPNL